MLNTLLSDIAEAVEPNVDWGSVWNTVKGWLLSAGIRLVIAILLMIVVFKTVDFLTKRLAKRLAKKNYDVTISRVGVQTLRIALKILVLVVLVNYVGIETASISAVIASIGVGISLAVQGTLSNFAGGVIIITMRPFRIGDFITSGNYSGTVEDIKLFYTHIVTPDNQAIMIPNGALANTTIVNVSAKDTRRMDNIVSIAYDADVDLAKKVLREVCDANELIFQDPQPFIALKEMGDSSLDLVLRIWCKRTDYWTVYFYLQEAVLKALNANGIEIPYNKLDVNVTNVTPMVTTSTAEPMPQPLTKKAEDEEQNA